MKDTLIDLLFLVGLGAAALGGFMYISTDRAPKAATVAVTIEEEVAHADRVVCDEIRGSDYRSDSEREWFIANCVSKVAVKVNSQHSAPPERPPTGSSQSEATSIQCTYIVCWTTWTIESSLCPSGYIQIEANEVDAYKLAGRSTRGACLELGVGLSQVTPVLGPNPCRVGRVLNIQGGRGYAMAC